MSLLLYSKLIQPGLAAGVDVSYITNLDHLAQGWKRSTLANGGYYLGTLQIKRGGAALQADLYQWLIGNVIKEITFGMISWEGLIWQMDLVKNGVNYRKTLDPKYWHNRVKVLYTDRDNEQQVIDWDEITSSSDIYGEMEYIYTEGGLHATGAGALQDRALAQYAYPRSRNVGGITVGSGSPQGSSDGLYITVAGLGATLNWRYYESSQVGVAASTVISTLVGLSEFITAGRIETNSTTTTVEGDNIPQRLGDLIKKVVEQGDTSGNLWRGGVYADQEYIYEQVPTTVDYDYINGKLYQRGGAVPIIPELIKPGFYIRDSNAPPGYTPPGTSDKWNYTQVNYCDMVEFDADAGILKLGLKDQDERAELFIDNIRRGGITPQPIPGAQAPPAFVPPPVAPPAPPNEFILPRPGKFD